MVERNRALKVYEVKLSSKCSCTFTVCTCSVTDIPTVIPICIPNSVSYCIAHCRIMEHIFWQQERKMCNFFLRKVTTVGRMKKGVSVLCRYPGGYSLVDKLDNFFSKKALTVDYSMNRILYSAFRFFDCLLFSQSTW